MQYNNPTISDLFVKKYTMSWPWRYLIINILRGKKFAVALALFEWGGGGGGGLGGGAPFGGGGGGGEKGGGGGGGGR